MRTIRKFLTLGEKKTCKRKYSMLLGSTVNSVHDNIKIRYNCNFKLGHDAIGIMKGNRAGDLRELKPHLP